MLVHSAVSGNPLIKPWGNYCLKLPGALLARRRMQGHVPQLSKPSGIECTLQIVHVFAVCDVIIFTPMRVCCRRRFDWISVTRRSDRVTLTPVVVWVLTYAQITNRNTNKHSRLKGYGFNSVLGCVSLGHGGGASMWECQHIDILMITAECTHPN